MKVILALVTILFIISTHLIKAYRILGVFPLQSRSHQLMFDAIIKGLLRDGHQVDVISVYPLKEKFSNYTLIIDLSKYRKSLENQWDLKHVSQIRGNIIPFIALTLGNDLCHYLSLPEIQKIIKNPPKNPPYDLLIAESHGAHCFIGLGYALKIPVVFATTSVEPPWLDQSLGQPMDTTAYFGAYFGSSSHPMTFFERVYNTFINYYNLFSFRRYTDDIQNDLMRKYIDPDIPPLRELEKNVALALVNSYHSLHGVRPMIPNLIEVGGLHVYEHYENIPHDLEKWMNESTAGVVYFTLGSMVRIETFPDDVLRAFYSVFRKIAPVRVLMKVADPKRLLPGLPENVRTSSWIPQVAVLAHNNTKIFITHGGLMSLQEALTFGVPMIGIPLFADQFANIDMLAKKNIALKLDYNNLIENNIYNVIDQVLTNPIYQKSATYESFHFLDRPLNAMDTSLFWIKYAIRHGAGALRSPTVELPWWQIALIDVYIFFILVAIVKAYILFKVYNKLYFVLFKNTSTKACKSHCE